MKLYIYSELSVIVNKLDLTKCSLADVRPGGPTQNELRIICQFLREEQKLTFFYIRQSKTLVNF